LRPDISSIRSDSFSPMLVHCFSNILLTRCPIDSIIFPLRSQLRGGHFYAVGWCVHYVLAGFCPWGLNLGHMLILAKEFDSTPFQLPLRSHPSVLQLVSETVKSLVVLNRLCDLKATWRKVPCISLSSMVRILVVEKIRLATIS
jgi:hypothetical protein